MSCLIFLFVCLFCRCFGCFTMDVIASVAFATQVDSQNNPDDLFVRHAQMFFSFSFFRPIMLFFSQLYYYLYPVYINYNTGDIYKEIQWRQMSNMYSKHWKVYCPVTYLNSTEHWVMCKCVQLSFQLGLHQQIWFVCPVAFPFIAAPLVRLIPNRRRDQMNQFFINSIQKIIKQREEQPPEQVNLTVI